MNRLWFFVVFVCLIFVSGCTAQIKDIKADPEKYIGEKVTVVGTASNTIKLGSLSGFTLSQGEDRITVSSETLPEEGATVTVKGVVMEELLIGTYIKAKEVSD